MPLEYGRDRIPEGWAVKYIEDESETNYLTFTAAEDGSSFKLISNSNRPNIQYSIDDGETWITFKDKDSVPLEHKGDKALIRGYNPEGFSSYKGYTSFEMTGKIAASGSVMSLIDGKGITTVIPNEKCFYCLFYKCASLTQAPELPATSLADRCYSAMFEGCTSLTRAPELPATSLADRCYSSMFEGCTNLSEIKVAFESWATTSIFDSKTEYWVKNVAPAGTFICPKSLPIEMGEDRIPEGWVVVDIESVGVNATTNDDIAVWSEGHTIYIRNAEGDVLLYDPSGRLISVSTGTVDETRSMSVPCQGIYFVRANGKTLTTPVR